MEKMSGKKALLEMLKSEGVKHIFGNPGTSEGPIIDMLGDYPELKYFLTLQESVAIGMAESYARLTGKASFVSLHVDSGLANGIALMLDAYNTGTPMVVTSANYDVRKITENKTDLAELVRPVTKWAVELTHPEQIPSAIRRAFNEANSHPKGPVYVGFTSNCLEEEAEMNIIPSANIYSNYYPDPIALINASDLILQSKSILILTGDRVADDDAVNEVVQLAEILGSPVYQSRGAEVSFPTNHPQYFGIHSLRSKSSREIIKDFDLVITIGMDTFEELFYWGDVILDSSTKLIHIDSVPGKVGKSEPTDIGIVSNCKHALLELHKILDKSIKNNHISLFSEIQNKTRANVIKNNNEFESSFVTNWDKEPIIPARMMYEISNSIPDNSIVIDDSVSNRTVLRHYINANKPGDLLGVRGQSIGGGIGATLGAKVAYPDRPVFGIIGDGSAMMTIQGLWTAANDNIPSIFIICNNGMYRVLKVNFGIYQKEILNVDEPAGEKLLYSDFGIPFDMAGIAKCMGLNSERVLYPNDIGPAIKRAIKSQKPSLIDIVIDGSL